jgi:tRNA-binding protein
MPLTWDEFRRVDVRVGRVLAAEDFPEARNPSYKLTIDFGPLGVKRSSAAVRPCYAKEDLVGRPVLAVVNFPPKQIANFMSECLVLGAVQADGRVILLRPDEEGELGARVA